MKTKRRVPIIVVCIGFAAVSIAAGVAAAGAAAEETMDDRCRAEVEQLHVFFEGWLGGSFAADPETFRRLEDVLAADFEIVSPRGERVQRDALVVGLMSAHGAHAGRSRPFRIRIENYAGRALGKSLHLATYEEWQVIDGESRGRLSSAFFRRRDDAPNGVEWVHLHETWLPRPSGDAAE